MVLKNNCSQMFIRKALILMPTKQERSVYIYHNFSSYEFYRVYRWLHFSDACPACFSSVTLKLLQLFLNCFSWHIQKHTYV